MSSTRSRFDPRRKRGYTMVEMVVVCALLVIVAAVALPTAKYSIKRGKEMELRQALRQMCNAIDEFKRYSSAIDDDVYKSLGAAQVVGAYITEGAAGPRQAKQQIAYWTDELSQR